MAQFTQVRKNKANRTLVLQHRFIEYYFLEKVFNQNSFLVFVKYGNKNLRIFEVIEFEQWYKRHLHLRPKKIRDFNK